MFFTLPLFQIVIDLSSFDRLTQLPLPELYLDIFLYGGWIPFAWVLWQGFSKLWLLSRQLRYAQTISYVLLNINIQRANEQSPKAVEHIFSHLAGTHSSPNFKEKWLIGKFSPPFSFEYASIDGYTQFLVRTPVQYRDLVEAAIFSQYPDAEIAEVADYTKAVPQRYPDPEWDCWGTEFVLAKPFPYSLRTWVEFEHSLSQELKDPLSSLLEAMSRLKKGEQVWLQIIVYPRDQDWAKEATEFAKKLAGKEVKKPVPGWAKAIHATTGFAEEVVRTAISPPTEGPPKKEAKKEEFKMLMLSPGERRTLEAIEMKLSKIGFGVKFRFVYVAQRPVFRKGPMISMIRGAIGLLGSLDGNSFKNYGKVAPKTDYFWQRWSADEKKTRIVRNFSNRSSYGATPFILNVEELASLYHFPSMLVKAPLIKKVESRKVEPPFSLPIASNESPKKP